MKSSHEMLFRDSIKKFKINAEFIGSNQFKNKLSNTLSHKSLKL